MPYLIVILLLIGGGYYFVRDKISGFFGRSEQMTQLYQQSQAAKVELEKYRLLLEAQLRRHENERAQLVATAEKYKNEAEALLGKLESNEQALHLAETALKASEAALREKSEQVKTLSTELNHLQDELTHNQEKRRILEEAFK